MPSDKKKQPKTLDELLILTENEKKAARALVSLAKGSAYYKVHEVYPHLRKASIGSIVKVCEQNLEFAQLCEEPTLKECWHTRLNRMRPGSASTLTMDGETISALDQIRGQYLLHKYFKSANVYGYDSAQALPLLQKAYKYRIYEAMQWQCAVMRQRLNDDLLKPGDIEKCIILANEIIRCHWLVGYLEASYLFLELGCYSDGKKNQEQGTAFFTSAIESLYLAEKLQENSYSQAALANAGNAGKKLLSENRDLFKDWSTARVNIAKLYSLEASDLDRAKYNANQKLKNIKIQLQVNRSPYLVKHIAA